MLSEGNEGAEVVVGIYGESEVSEMGGVQASSWCFRRSATVRVQVTRDYWLARDVRCTPYESVVQFNMGKR